jgi:CRISP-associated protein Cas1
MTLKGHKNHYGVKLLRGYGVAIRVKDNQIVLRSGTDPFTKKVDIEEWFVTQIPYERIVIVGKGYVTTESIDLLSKNNVNIILLDSFGNLITNMTKVMSSNTGTKYRIAQYDTFRNDTKTLYLQNEIVKAKLESQIVFLESLNHERLRERVACLQKYLRLIDGTKTKRELLTIESRTGNVYFRTYCSLFEEKYGFISRRGGGLTMSNRYAGDVINALLNYGYSLLASEITRFVNGIGLDPYFGFYHKPDTSFQALVYDMIEPFRWLVEHTVYKLASDTNHNHPIRKREYAWTRDGRIILDSSLIGKFLEMLERKFQSERPYKFRHGLKRADGLSMCQEITIAKISIQNLADFCT